MSTLQWTGANQSGAFCDDWCETVKLLVRFEERQKMVKVKGRFEVAAGGTHGGGEGAGVSEI